MTPSDSPPAKRAKTTSDVPDNPDEEDLTFDHPRNDIILRPGRPRDASGREIASDSLVEPQKDGSVVSLIPGRTVFPFRSSILANSIEIFESMFADVSPAKGKVVSIRSTDADTLRTFLHLLSPSISYPVTATLASLPYSTILPLFRLAHRYDADWICAELEHKLFNAKAAAPQPGQSSNRRAAAARSTPADLQPEDVFSLFEYAFFLSPEPMYCLAARTMTLFPRPFQLSALPKPLKLRLAKEAPEFLIAAQDFYDSAPVMKPVEGSARLVTYDDYRYPISDKEASTKKAAADMAKEGWVFNVERYQTSAEREKKGPRQMCTSDKIRAKINTATMFEEAGLDCDRWLYWKGPVASPTA